jgi:ribosomal protein S18 acetylase RimI-like enzyme
MAVIRRAVPADAEQIHAIGQSAFSEFEKTLGWSQTAVEQMINNKAFTSIVAEDTTTNHLLGFSLSTSAVKYGFDGALIEWTATRKPSGLGAKLFIALMDLYLQQGVNVYADIRYDNIIVKNMLKRAGFTKIKDFKSDCGAIELFCAVFC